MRTLAPVVRTRPCAICGAPIPLRWPRGNQRVHAGDCLVTKMENRQPLYRCRPRTPKETP